MLPIIKEVKQKMRGRKGFTLVELMVVLVILAILATLAGAGLIAYTRLARFQHNESNARTVFQAAQIALTRKDTGGDMDDFLTQLPGTGTQNGHFTADGLQAQYGASAEEKAKELNSRIVALYYDKSAPDTAASQLVYGLIGPYLYDESIFNASITLEIDSLTGQIYSAFYDTASDKMRFSADGDTTGATIIDDRTYDHRRNDSLVGYYSAEDTVNVVTLSQTRLKVKNPQLINNETLTLNWSSNSQHNDLDTIYDAEFYSTTDSETPLFKLEIEWKNVAGKDENARIKVYTQYDKANKTWRDSDEYYSFPLSYSKGRFILTLDAMCDATLLRGAENEPAAAKTTLFSITRLVNGAQDIYVKMKARPNEDFPDAYTESKEATSNTENTLFAGKDDDGYTLTYFRHLYNLRWVDASDATKYTLENNKGLTKNDPKLDWTDGSVTVYCAGTKTTDDSTIVEPVAKVPSRTGEVVAWPTIPKVNKNVTLTADGTAAIRNLQIRSTSVAAHELESAQAEYLKYDHYVGLIGENNGTISNITLNNPDVLVNAEVKAAGTQSENAVPIDADNTQYLQPLPTTDTAYRSQIWAVGALVGLDTGNLENCSIQRTGSDEARVMAAIAFSDNTVSTDRVDGTSIQDEPHGLGGIVGVAMPESDAVLKKLVVGSDSTNKVAIVGCLQDTDAEKNLGTPASESKDAAEKERYNDIATGRIDTILWRAVGIGGVAGVLDVTDMGSANANKTVDLSSVTNKADVVGNGFVGGVAGNLYTTADNANVTVANLVNDGTVMTGANYHGDEKGKSAVLGQFYGGIAGYAGNLTLQDCTSASLKGLDDEMLAALLQAGYNADGSLKETSPLKGDFVGGLVGFARDVRMDNCSTVDDTTVLGRTFVGGLAGGFVGSKLKTSGGTNNCDVFGNRYVGGIVSVNGAGSTIDHMVNGGLVAGFGKDAAYVGGITGVNDATWGVQTASAAQKNAILLDNTNKMDSIAPSDEIAFNRLKTLSRVGDDTAYCADFVGGVTGYNGAGGEISWQEENDNEIGTVLYGNNYVGGVAGYNDAQGLIQNGHDTSFGVTGIIVGEGDCVGGLVGLNCAAQLPAVQVKANHIEGVHFVGGVVGANLPVDGFGFVNAANQPAIAETVAQNSDQIVADGVVGGIIGYNRVIATPALTAALQSNAGLADGLRTLLPTFSTANALTEPELASGSNTVTLTGLKNTYNIDANAYVGGIIGYNSVSTKLTLADAKNGGQNLGGLSYGNAQYFAGKQGYRLADGVSLGALDAAHNGYFAGGIIGYATANTTLQNCVNYGTVWHTVAAGGLAGVNDGTITGGSMQNSMGSQQDNYRYLGGIAGINNGTITDAAPAAGSFIRGGTNIGGVAGYNSEKATITLKNATGKVDGITAVGGVAGYNLGKIIGNGEGSSVAVQVNGTSQVGGVAGFNGATGKIGTRSKYDKLTLNSTSVTANNEGGGAVGHNEGNICNVTNEAGRVHVDNQYMGGIAGRNYGTIEDSNYYNDGTSTDTLYAGGGYAGGITGCNEAGATIDGVGVQGRVTAANGEAGGVTAHNYGYIRFVALRDVHVHGTSSAIGGVAAANERATNATSTQDAVIENVALRSDGGGVTLYGPATKVGGLVGYNAGTVKYGIVEANTLNLVNLTASANTVTAGGAVGENVGTVGGENTTDAVVVETDLTQSMEKYLNLGGVAGSNSGTLVECTYQGTIGNGNGIANAGSTVGGIVGSNDANGTVQDCEVKHITLHVQGASNVGASQDAAAKLTNAAHIGGIVGRNSGTVNGSTIATDDTRSEITAHNGFVGGVAGSNSGSITNSGGKDTQELVKQIDTWLDEKVDTATQNANLNAMVRVLTNATYTEGVGSKPQATQSDDETALVNKFKVLQGVDEISNDGEANQLKITLEGGTKKDDFANGYLGGITGFNAVTGQISNSASGKWFVYANNINQSWGAVGGIIGQNESNAASTSGLVNFAAVRRYVVGFKETKDDDANNGVDRWSADYGRSYTCDVYEPKNDISNNYVGGIIGTQQNRTSDNWTLQNCVNLGTIFNSRSNNAGGVLAYWLGYGGTLDNCYNFGNITTNANSGSNASGTVGGIAGYFSAPVAGTSADLYRCSNYGSVVMKDYGANDVGGVFGKVEMDEAHADDAMTINITECVNGANVSLHGTSMTVGIFGYLGPWGSVPNVALNLTRCRNYCTVMKVNRTDNHRIGIVGNRGDGSESNEYTTVTDCFTLAANDWAYPIAYTYPNNDHEWLRGERNYYMDTIVVKPPEQTVGYATSFNGYPGIDGLQEGLGNTKPTNGEWISGDKEPDNSQRATKAINAHRLYAGVYKDANAATDGDNYYTYFAMLPKLYVNDDKSTYRSDVSLQAVQPSNSFIMVENGQSFGNPASPRYVMAFDTDYNEKSEAITPSTKGYVGKILLLFNEADGNSKTSAGDITDEVLQRYYSNILDNSAPLAPKDLAVKRSDDTGDTANPKSVYGRYLVTWTARTDGNPASYYHVTVYETNENGEATGNTLLEADAYDTRFTFEVKKEWRGHYFNVSVAGVNSKGTGEQATLTAPMQFARALPTPQLQVRLMPDGDQFSQMLVLTNADAYKELVQSGDLTDWTVTARVAQGQTCTFTDSDADPKHITEGLGATRRIMAEATSKDDRWMRSAQYDQTSYLPAATSAGLAPGTLQKSVEVEGETIDNLEVTTTLNFKPDVSGIQPTYRVMLLGRYTGDEKVTLNGEEISLQNQYITLAAQQATVPNGNATFRFTHLPDDALTHYDDWTVVAVPVDSGHGDAVTRWDATDAEALQKLQTSVENGKPAAWYGGLEIVRNGSNYSFANLTPLYFVNTDATDYKDWAVKAADQVLYDRGKLTVAQAPTLTNVPTDGTLYDNYDKDKLDKTSANYTNQLVYTFTWQQPDESDADAGKTAYKLTLYGITDSGNEETIALPADASSQIKYDKDTKTYSYTLNIDENLATDADQTNGSNSWRFDKVRLRVTRDTTNAGSNVIGAADSATYTVLRRLRQPGQPGQFIYSDTTNAEQTRYQISWPAVADERVDHYELWARVQDANGTLGQAFEMYPYDGNTITGTQATVDLEAYQGQTLVFYVVACPADGRNVLRSPNGEASDPQTIITRTDAPKISGVTFTWPGKETEAALPLMNTFSQNLTIQMNVGDSAGTSYYFTGYLFSDADAYAKACALAKEWMADSTNKDKLDALNEALGNATLMIPNAYRTVGAETQLGSGTVAYTVTPSADGFTMRPDDANRYLLPALRTMVSSGAQTSSRWTFYVPDDVQKSALHLPKIELDKPEKDGVNSLTAVTSTVKGDLYGTDDIVWSPSSDNITITQYAVQWPAVNEYTQDGVTQNFADTYRFHITLVADAPENAPNAGGFDIQFTVATQDETELDENGNEVITTHRGQILNVKKLPNGENDWIDITKAAGIKDDDGNVIGYDLSLIKQPVLDEDGNPTDETVLVSAPVTLTGHHEMNGDNPIYRIAAVPTLREAEMSDASIGYLVTLPDMAQPAESDNNMTARAHFTAEVQVWAVGDGEKTANSQVLTVALPDVTQLQQEDADRPAVVMAEAPTQPSQTENTAPTTPADDAGAGEGIATPETAAPAA